MKFIHSFWSKPFSDASTNNNWNLRYHGGFPNAFLFYCSWTYSCLSIQKYYPNLHLVTDEEGMYIFRDVLKLLYKSFSTDLEKIDDYNPGLWALGKLHAYKIQDEPFCHLDGDVFLFGPVLDDVLHGKVFCQSFDEDTDQYAEIHPYIHKNFKNVPEAYNASLSDGIKLINAGILGGNDLSVFQEYTANAFELIDNNHDVLEQINVGLLNLYYEQFLFSNMVRRQNIEVASLFSEDGLEPNFAAFHQIPTHSRYVHLISHLKRSTEFMEQVVTRLQFEFPDYYERVSNHFKIRSI